MADVVASVVLAVYGLPLLFDYVCYSITVLVTTFDFAMVGLLGCLFAVVLVVWWFVGRDCCLLFGCLRL